MTGFMNQDGSALVGGLTLAGIGQAFLVDGQGNLAMQPWQMGLQVQGKSYACTTGLLNVAAGNYPLCIFNPATSGKSILIYSLHASSGTASTNSISVFLQSVTSNPAYSLSATPSCNKAGGAASAIAGSCTFANTSQTLAAPYVQVEISTIPIELLHNGTAMFLPNGTASGLTIFVQTYASGFSTISASWLEF